ncbi:MAG TPA: ABC transporter ATP-binding protein [Kofleriaceae bacterium]|jgi:branched-chain amino acid transport system ATP-binding protein|nr:ABC transporter ATP-binding protein [Kofleriaceae bacterium]
MTELLQARGLAKSFRGLRAVAGASFDVAEGEIAALIGPNGAGKTTVFNLIAGVYAPDAGTIHFAGRPIHGLRPDQVCAAGIGRTFQLVKPFPALSVLDNVVVGALRVERTVAGARAAARVVLDRLELEARAAQPAATLTLSDRRRLEIARALATRPRLLLLDEVMAGLRPTECDQLVEVFRDLHRSEGLTILLIEHVMRAVMALAQRIAVLDRGEVIATGTPGEVVHDPAVLSCYLGEDTEL